MLAEAVRFDEFFIVQGGCSSMVEQKPSKLMTRVRFPSPAPVAEGGPGNLAMVRLVRFCRLCGALPGSAVGWQRLMLQRSVVG